MQTLLAVHPYYYFDAHVDTRADCKHYSVNRVATSNRLFLICCGKVNCEKFTNKEVVLN